MRFKWHLLVIPHFLCLIKTKAHEASPIKQSTDAVTYVRQKRNTVLIDETTTCTYKH